MSSILIATRRPVLADLIPGARIRDALLVMGGAGLTGLAAQITLHTSLTPVPFTLQTLSVLVVGAALGTLRALTSMTVYLVAGGAGVPWFASHSHGFGGPSFGYVIGFVAAAAAVGYLAEHRADRRFWSTTVVMIVGNVMIYLFGASWLAASLHLDAATTFRLGIQPFLIGDAVKIALAALALPAAWRVTRRK